MIGVRETRRIRGEYEISFADMQAGRRFPDGFATCAFGVDHPPAHGQEPGKRHSAHPPVPAAVPLSGTASGGKPAVAGRCISGCFEAHASLPRHGGLRRHGPGRRHGGGHGSAEKNFAPPAGRRGSGSRPWSAMAHGCDACKRRKYSGPDCQRTQKESARGAHGGRHWRRPSCAPFDQSLRRGCARQKAPLEAKGSWQRS